MNRRIVHISSRTPDTVPEKSDIKGLLTIIATFSLLAMLYAAKDVLVPLAVAFLGAQALAPVASWFERKGVPTAIAAFGVVATAVLVILGVITVLSRQMVEIQAELPTMSSSFGGVWHTVQNYAVRFGLRGSANDAVGKLFESIGAWAVSVLGGTVVSLAMLGLIGILTMMFLTYRSGFLRQLNAVASIRHWQRFSTMTKRVATVGPHYLLGLSSVVLIVIALDTVFLALVGAPYPVFFGILGGLAVLIPYLGIVIIGPTCALLTLLVTGDTTTTALVVLVYSLVHFFEGNLLSPWLVGKHVDLNPLMTLIAVIIGGELWGPAGMFLAVPAFGMVKIVLSSFSDTAWMARLMGRINV